MLKLKLHLVTPWPFLNSIEKPPALNLYTQALAFKSDENYKKYRLNEEIIIPLLLNVMR